MELHAMLVAKTFGPVLLLLGLFILFRPEEVMKLWGSMKTNPIAMYLGVVSPLENIVEDLKSLPPDRLEMAASFIRRLKPISRAEREAALSRTFGCLSPEEADELAAEGLLGTEDGAERSPDELQLASASTATTPPAAVRRSRIVTKLGKPPPPYK